MKKRILALDYGKKRIGVAISDETLSFASTSKTIEMLCPGKTVDEISKICVQNNISHIVIGMPQKMNGNEGTMAEEVKKFASIVEAKTKCNVILWDERLTSAEAERVLLSFNISRKQRKKIIDQISAKIILQTYLNFINNKN